MKVVIVGGGFGGVKAALELSKDKKMQVTLVSDRDHFLFYPALYATATGRSKRESIIPLTKILANTSVKLVQDTVTSIDAARRIVVTSNSQIQYDRIVLALGVVTSYFGIEGLDEYSYSIKSAHELARFKQHLHDDISAQKKLDKNYIIVGAGPTGIELSAALAHYLRRIAKNHGIRQTRINLSLVEAAPRVLPRMSERASALVTKELRRIGVKVLTNKKVQGQDDDSIIISGKDVPSKTVVWTSGVANHPLFASHPDLFVLAPNGRVQVDEFLRTADRHVFVIGDNAATQFTGLAQTAIHDAVFVARTLAAEVRNKTPKPYRAKKQPVVIPVGERWALFEFGKLRATGLVGALISRAANFVGYLDYFPLPAAAKLWLSGSEMQEECTSCQ